MQFFGLLMLMMSCFRANNYNRQLIVINKYMRRPCYAFIQPHVAVSMLFSIVSDY